MFQNLDFTPYILEVFWILFFKVLDVWILHLKVSEFKIQTTLNFRR